MSQARRVEVYSWRSGGTPLWSYLDIDEVTSGALANVPAPRAAALPEFIPIPRRTASGTLVVWSKCDRLDFKRITTLEQKLRSDLGRVFRRAIWRGIAITVNGHRVAATDPLFLRETEWGMGAQPVPPLEYDIRRPGGGTSRVMATFSVLPVAEWHSWTLDEKRARGIVGGGGVSVLRAGREIAFGWHFMDGKRKQNYDDWWRVEISFEPALDELMGVTHSKQGVRPTKELQEILGPDIGGIARMLSTRIRNEFAALDAVTPSAARRASSRDWRLSRVPVRTGSGQTLMTSLDYRISIEDSDDPEFFQWEIANNRLEVRVNRNHPFFRVVYAPLHNSDAADDLLGIEILMLALARAGTLRRTRDDLDAKRLLRAWSDALAAFLGD